MHIRSIRPRRRRLLAGGVLTAAFVALTAPVAAQSPAPPRSVPAAGPAVGEPAPDFALVGATRYGVLRDSVRLSSFRGKTVVLAFFYKARTKG